MDSIVLAGGFAKRMLPLTKNTPKQLLDVAGETMLSHVLKSLEEISPERVIISVNSFFSANFSQFIDDYSDLKNLIRYIKLYKQLQDKIDHDDIIKNNFKTDECCICLCTTFDRFGYFDKMS